MIAIERQTRRERRQLAARVKLATSMTTTLAYATLGAALIGPAAHGPGFGAGELMLAAVGASLLVSALWMVPHGEVR